MKRNYLILLLMTVMTILVMLSLLWHKGPLPSREEVNETLKELAISLHQGQPLQEGIRSAINRATNPRLKKAWENVLKLVSQGYSLSRAMSTHRDVFPTDLISAILKGELKGNVDAALIQYTAQFER
ncbi:MAG: type II secretion system F family protein [Armatimonadota bacterium]|nr:type II secretion system F family protein [Armatimonadota bacterium]MDW8143391.1 type II secretion system F family protein [Armatimonadota bacterium]